MEISLRKIAVVVSSKIEAGNDQLKINHIEFDSRKVTSGALFVPLQGGQQDGHKFINSAAQNGAVATLVEKGHSTVGINIPFLVVEDVQEAILKLSEYCLHSIHPKVVAVTGSNGKTTTKDLIYSVLSKKYVTWRTKDNYNNEIGIPYTIISMPEDTQVLVIEIGIDGFNQMEKMSFLVEPDIAVITMIGEAHIEFFKTRQAIAVEKLKIAKFLKPGGTLIINGDEPLLVKNKNDLNCRVEMFGKSRKCDIYPFDIKTSIDNSSYHSNLTDNETINIPLIGEYNVINSLAAILVAKKLNLNDSEIKTGLLDLRLTKNRAEWVRGAKGEKILDDAYNSNPTALKVILNVFRNLKTSENEKKMVVLGDMLELGENSKELHADIASELPPNVFDNIYLYGSDIFSLYEKLKPFYQTRVHYFKHDEYQELENQVEKDIDEKTYVLIKASHGLHLERLVTKLAKL